jgi:hypothetical protein
MKTLLFMSCLLCATLAVGQSSAGVSALSSEPIRIEVPSHPQHASQQSLSGEQSLLITSEYLYAQGERPLWEVAPATHAEPLGDVARMLRKQHADTKKTDTVWVN